jgi:hypothetical protein
MQKLQNWITSLFKKNKGVLFENGKCLIEFSSSNKRWITLIPTIDVNYDEDCQDFYWDYESVFQIEFIFLKHYLNISIFTKK